MGEALWNSPDRTGHQLPQDGKQLPSAKSPASQLETATVNDDSNNQRPWRLQDTRILYRKETTRVTPQGPVAHPILLVTCIVAVQALNSSLG